MSDPKYLFQYCPKLVVFSKDYQKVLLARRHGESDYDGTFSFIGGKTEITDESLVAGIKREKDEEISSSAHLKIYTLACQNVLFRKSDGSTMIVPHYLAQFIEGEINLNEDEYSEYKWVALEDLEKFEPKIENIPEKVRWALNVKQFAKETDFVEI